MKYEVILTKTELDNVSIVAPNKDGDDENNGDPFKDLSTASAARRNPAYSR